MPVLVQAVQHEDSIDSARRGRKDDTRNCFRHRFRSGHCTWRAGWRVLKPYPRWQLGIYHHRKYFQYGTRFVRPYGRRRQADLRLEREYYRNSDSKLKRQCLPAGPYRHLYGESGLYRHHDCLRFSARYYKPRRFRSCQWRDGDASYRNRRRRH